MFKYADIYRISREVLLKGYFFVGLSGHLGVSDWSVKDAVVDFHWLSVHSFTVMSG